MSTPAYREVTPIYLANIDPRGCGRFNASEMAIPWRTCCTRRKGHRGPHSWQLDPPRGQPTAVTRRGR